MNYTKEEYESAKNANIIDFLHTIGYELERKGVEYCGKLHNSLVIRDDGAWFWNSKNIGGRSPIELYKQILIYDYGMNEKSAFMQAIKELFGNQGVYNTPKITEKPMEKARAPNVPLKLPEKNLDNSRVINYLTKIRGIDIYFISGLIKSGKLYEAKNTRNCVFVAYDKNNQPQNAFQRGTLPDKPFKKDVENSDKSYGFTLNGNLSASKVYVFESAIDAISHANLSLNQGLAWREAHRISLGGVSSRSLERFLAENPQIKEVVFALDNDEAGERACEKMERELDKKYKVSCEKPKNKDWNEDLCKNQKSLIGNLEAKKTEVKQDNNINKNSVNHEKN